MADPLTTLHVVDSSVWIALADEHPKILYNLCELVELSAIRIGVPGPVHSEIVVAQPEWLASRKKAWQSRIGELEKFSELLARTEDPLSESPKPSVEYRRMLRSMRESVEKFDGDPHRKMVSDLLTSRNVVRIPVTGDIFKKVVEQGLRKRKPFSTKNSVADAVILFSVIRWAERHPEENVCFHTLNTKDFSSPESKKSPHPHIAECFEPNSRLSYSANLSSLAGLVRGLDPADLYPRNAHGCSVCDSPVLIDSISCKNCGAWPADAPDHEEFKLRPFREGYLVDVLGFDDEGYRLSCDECGRKTFDIELSDLCSYHEHVTREWDKF